MFTGIVEEVGTIERVQKGRHSAVLSIRAKTVLEDAKIGDSIAINGVCLTVTSRSAGGFTADVMHETLNRSALAGLKSGSHVNLERAMAANGRFGGHIVAGHVDGVGRIVEIRQDDTAVWYTVQADAAVMRYIVEKGSVTIDGISLTVAKVFADRFAISAIPHTAKVTILGEKKKGDLVNLETDMVGKYIEKFLQEGLRTQPAGAGEENGFAGTKEENGFAGGGNQAGRTVGREGAGSAGGGGQAGRTGAASGAGLKTAGTNTSGGLTREFLAKYGF